MSFIDDFRKKYRVAREAARANNSAETEQGLKDICELFRSQYELKNGDPMITKIKLSEWLDVFNKYLEIIKKCGLTDKRIQRLFGFIDDDALPSFGDIIKNGGKTAPNKIPDPSGLFVPDLPSSGASAAGASAAENGVGPDQNAGSAGAAGTPNDKSDAPPAAAAGAPAAGEEAPAAEAEAGAPNEVAEPEPRGENVVIVPQLGPDSFDNFIGQREAVEQLRKEIAIARHNGQRHLDNILLLGNPGLGKTTLMKVIANELNVPIEIMDCSQYRNSQVSQKQLQSFLQRVARLGEPVVIGMDEMHMLNEQLQAALLTLLNDRVYVSPPDVNGRIWRTEIDEFTFIGATTNEEQLLPTIKDRCLRLTFRMKEYSRDELQRIYRARAAAMGLTITDDAINSCIPRSRGSLRYVKSFIEDLDKELYDDSGRRVSTHIDINIANRYFERKGIDPVGLLRKDLEILNALLETQGHTLSAETLAQRVNLGLDNYKSEYEPYLIRIRFIEIINRGRILTERAIKYLRTGELE